MYACIYMICYLRLFSKPCRKCITCTYMSMYNNSHGDAAYPHEMLDILHHHRVYTRSKLFINVYNRMLYNYCENVERLRAILMAG